MPGSTIDVEQLRARATRTNITACIFSVTAAFAVAALYTAGVVPGVAVITVVVVALGLLTQSVVLLSRLHTTQSQGRVR